jgi:putative transposase
VSVRKAIELGRFSHGGWYAKSQARDQSALRLRIHESAHARPRFGYQRIHVMLRREGWNVNRNACIAVIASKGCKSACECVVANT